MEMIYGDDYLSPGGQETSTSLSELGQIRRASKVLDLGSGLGGAAFFLNQSFACSVDGFDLMAANVAEANRRAEVYQISKLVAFSVGDATQLPIDDCQYQVIWGQDAWCHIDSKESLISEAHRMLKPGGTIVFSDWLLLDSDAKHVKDVTASPNMCDASHYQVLLSSNGFDAIRYIDTSATYTTRYQDVLSRLHNLQEEITKRFGNHVFDIVLSKQECVRDAFESGALGAGYFAAQKP